MVKSTNIFAAIPTQLNEELFEQLLSNDKVLIERIVSKGHQSPESGWYDQDKNEWVILLEGGAIVSFQDGEDVSLSKGDYLHIPAHQKHRVKWTEPDQKTIWLAIHY